MELEFHSMKRKQLQALCKKHGIPANLTNLEMANRLSSLLKETENPDAYEQSSSTNLVVEIDSVVAPREAKKVRFSPEIETFIFLPSEAKVKTISKRTRRTFKKDLQESSLHVRSIASEVESSASKKQVVGRRISKRLKSSGSEVISISSEAESSSQKKPVGKRRVSKTFNSSNPVETENVAVIEKLLPVVETTRWKLRSRGFAGEKGNGFDDGYMEASKKNVSLKQRGRITRQSKCQLNDNSTTQHGYGKTESGSIKVVPEIIEGKKSIKRASNMVCREEIKVLVEPQDKGAVPRRSRGKSVGLQAKDPQEPVIKANEDQNHMPVRQSSRCVSKRQSFVQQNSIQEVKVKKQRSSSMESLAKGTSETESFAGAKETSEHVVDFTATNHSEAQVPRTSRRSIRANYPQESVMKENELQSQVSLSSRCALKRQSLAPSNSVSVAQAKKQKSSGLRSLAKDNVVDFTATTHKEAKTSVAESVGVENPAEVKREIVQLVEDKVNNGSCVVSHKTASLTSYLDCKDVFLKLDAVRDSELSSKNKICSIHEELLCVDRMDKSNDDKYTVAVQVNISGSPVTVTNGRENEKFNELQNQSTAQPSAESVPIAPAYLSDQETRGYSRIVDTDENAEQDENSGNEMSPKHSEVSVIVSESLQDEVVCLISGEENHDLEGDVDYAPRDHSLGLSEDTRESPANMTVLDANESEIMKCTDATELQESEGVHVSGDSISLKTTYDNGLSFRKVSLNAERDSPKEPQSIFHIELEEYNALEKSSYSPEQSPKDEEENAPINLSLQFSQNTLVGRFTCHEFSGLKDDDGTEGLSSAAEETDEAGPKLSDSECQNNSIEKGSQEDSQIQLASETCENDASLSEEIGLPIAVMEVDECAPEANTMKEIAAAEVDVEDCAGSKYCDQCDEEAKEMGSEDLKQTALPMKSCNIESSPETVLETPGAFNKRETDTEMETDLETKIGSLDDQKDDSATIFEEEASGSIRGGAESVKTYPVYMSSIKMLNSPHTIPRRQNSSFQLEELFKASSEKSNNPTEVDADGGGGGADLECLSFQSYLVNEAVSMMNDSVSNGEQHDCIDQKQVTELCPSLGLPSHGKLEEIASSIDNSYESHGTTYDVMASLGKESDCLSTLGGEPLGVEREETTIFQKCHSQDSLDCSRQEEIVGTIFNQMAPNADEVYAGEAVDEKTTVDAKLDNGEDTEESNDEYEPVSPDSCAADNVMDEGPQKESHTQLILPELRTREDDEAFHIIPDSLELNTERFNIADTIGDGGIDESRSTSLEVMASLVKGSECLLQIHEIIQESKPLNVERGETLQECCGQDSAYLVSNAAEICAGEATNDAKLDGGEDIDEMEVKDPVHDTAVSSIVSGNGAVYLEIQNNLAPSSHEEDNDEYHELAPDSCAADNVTDEGSHKDSHMQLTLPELQTREVDEVFHLIPDSGELNVDKSGIIADTIGGDDMDESRATSLDVTTSLEKGSECLLQIHEMILEIEPVNVERQEISTVQEFCGQHSAYHVSSAAEICAGEATNVAKLDDDEDTCTDEMEVKDLVQDTADSVTSCGNDAVSLEKENYFGQHSSDQSPSSHVSDFLEGEYEVFTEWEMRLFSSGVPKELEKEPTGSQQKDDTEMIDPIEMTDTEVFTELEIRLLSAESTGSQQKDDTKRIDLIEMTDTEVFTELEVRLLSAESTGSKRVNENADSSELREDLVVPKDFVVEKEDPKAEEVRNLEDSGSAICKDLVVEDEDPKAEEGRNLEDSGSAICNEAFLYNKKPHKEEDYESLLENSTEIRNLSNANCEDDSTVVKECTDCYNEDIACKDSKMVECAAAFCDSAINIDDRAAQDKLRLSNHSGESNTERSNIIADTIGGDDTYESAPISLEVMTNSVKESDGLLQIHEIIPESESFGVERGVKECCHEDSGDLVRNALEIGSGEAAKLDGDEDTDEIEVKDPVQDTVVSSIVCGNDAVSLVIQNDFGQDSSDRFPSCHVNDFLEGESEVFTEREMMLFSSIWVPKELEKEPTGSQQKEETGRSRHNTEMMGDVLEMTDTDVFTDWEIKLLSEEYTGSERTDDNTDPSEARGDLVVSKDLVVENEDPKADKVSNLEGSGNAICNEAFLYVKNPNKEEELESYSTEVGILSNDSCEDDSTDCDNEDIFCKDSRIVECTTALSDSAMNIDDRAALEKLRCSNHMISSSMGRTKGKHDVIAVTPMNILDMKENVVSSKGQHLTATKSVAKRQPLKDLQQKLI